MESQKTKKIDQQIPQLIAELGDPDTLKRQRARLVLVHREQESVSALLEAMKSPNEFTRWEAVRAPGDIREPDMIPALIDRLQDQNTGVRWAAMESLIRMGRHSLRPLLETFVENFDSLWLREGLYHILHVLKDRHQLNNEEIGLFEKLDTPYIPGFESSWTSDQAWAAEKALEALDREMIR